MGNLSVENNRSTYSRKPIFNQNNSLYHDQTSRSMSPYLLNTSRSNIYKSTITRRDKLNISTQKSRINNNRIYLNPALVKSVIKDTSNTDHARLNNKRLMKNPKVNMTSSLILPSKAFNQTRSFFPSKKKYEEKAFQQSSPTRAAHFGEDHDPESDFEKQNSKSIVVWPKNLQKLKHPQVFTNSPINRPNVSLSKLLRSDCSSTRNYGPDGHLLPSPHECCYHQHFHELSEKQKVVLCDNAPTQRKRTNRVQQPSQQMPNAIKTASRAKPDVLVDFNYETGKKTAYPANFTNDNREKCQQIIKRVRNFNEFLNQIKSKIKKEYSNLTSHHNTAENTSMSEQEQSFNARNSISVEHHPHNSSLGTEMQESKTNYSKSITLALRLENQKIQLEKYRKLVERELSKQHSIESIEIQSKNKEKIITINFDKNQGNSQKTRNTKRVEKGEEQNLITKTYKMGKDKGVKISKKKAWQDEKEDGQKIQKRIGKINNLFSKMEGMNQAQIDSYKQISQILNDQESGDSTL